MSLESGQYYIYTAAGGFPIGRKPIEPPLLGARRRIYKLPKGIDSVWEVERLDNGNYKLKNRDVIVGGIASGDLLAYVDSDGVLTATEWVFKRDLWFTGGNAYLITMANDDPNGWVVQESEPEPEPKPKPEPDNLPHIVLRPLIAGQSYPPTYPLNDAFIFKKVDA